MTPAPISVERFKLTLVGDINGLIGPFPAVEASPHGDFIHHSDYAALLHHLAETKGQSDRLCGKYLAALSRAEAAESKLAEREAEVERLRIELEVSNTACGEYASQAMQASFRAQEAERAREEATGLLREVEPEINELSNIYYSEFSNTKREKETEALHSRIAAFLAASGGAAQ